MAYPTWTVILSDDTATEVEIAADFGEPDPQTGDLLFYRGASPHVTISARFKASAWSYFHLTDGETLMAESS